MPRRAFGDPLPEVAARPPRPTNGAKHALARELVTHGVLGALIERHEDVAAERELNVNGGFWREAMG